MGGVVSGVVWGVSGGVWGFGGCVWWVGGGGPTVGCVGGVRLSGWGLDFVWCVWISRDVGCFTIEEVMSSGDYQ